MTVDLERVVWRAPHEARLYLEPWTAAARSCVWDLTARRAPDTATPPDTAETAPVRDLLDGLFTAWDALAGRGELPTRLVVLEVGVGDGHRAKLFLDELLALNTERCRDYYGRVRYLMGGASPQALDRARVTAVEHAGVRTVVLDPAMPSGALWSLRGQLFLVSVREVYSRLPTDEIVRIDGRTYCAQARTHVPAAVGRALAGRTGIPVTELPRATARLVGGGPEALAEAMPEQFPTADAATRFWADICDAVGVERRYVPVDLRTYEIAPGIGGRELLPLLPAAEHRMAVSNGAAASLVETLGLLHPDGRLQCHDLFVTDGADGTDVGGLDTGGPVVNRVNGPLLRALAAGRGHAVTFAPLGPRTGTTLATLTATRTR